MSPAPPSIFQILLVLSFPLLSLSVPHNPIRTECLSNPPLICTFQPSSTYPLSGDVHLRPYFRKSHCYTRVTATLRNLPPGPHGFHIHTFGDISAPDFTSAGGHFTNPTGDEILHGLPNDGVRHWGDFGNFEAGPLGKGLYKRIDMIVEIDTVLGRSFVVHEGPDLGSDSQPSGGAGARIGACVIGFENV